MTCESARESLLEAARRRMEPDNALSAHLNGCTACSERWKEQRSLTTKLRIMRIQAAGTHSPEQLRSTLLNEFAAQHPATTGRRWLWSVAAAAVFIIAAFVAREVKKPVSVGPNVASEVQTDPQDEGFIEVPYAPPLAQGELVTVIHTELQPAALASMGVNVDPSWTTALPADLLVGQDGFPRAVRVSDDSSSESGS